MNDFSMLDAFKALNEIEDDVLLVTPKKTGKIGAKRLSEKKLNEAITVDLNAPITPEQGDEVIKEVTTKADHPLTVVDVNADTLEHVKDNISYVGQVILKCKKCQGLRFVDMDKITETDEEISDGGETIKIFNMDDECPTCHSEGIGFEIVGQVAQAPEEKIENEEKIVADNDAISTEERAEQEIEINDESNEDQEDKVEDENTEVDSEEKIIDDNDVPEDDTETEIITKEKSEEDAENFSETDAKDDTEDLKLPKFGDEIDVEEVEEDDTDTNESLADGTIRGLLNGLSEKDGEIKEEEEEVFEYEKPLIIDDSENSTVADYIEENTETCDNCEVLKDLFSLMIEPENIEQCEIYSIDKEPKLLYQGTCAEIPETFKQSSIEKFDTAGSLVLINAGDIVKDDARKISDILNLYNDDEDEVISVTDQESGEEIFFGKRDDAIKEIGDREFISIEAPKALVLYVKPDTEVAEIEKTELSEKDELLNEILDQNNLSKYKLNDKNSLESWINETLIEQDHEELSSIYSSFVRPTHDLKLIESFKSFTGYKDALDLVYEEFSDLFEAKPRNDNEDEAIKNARELLKANPKCEAVVYGYVSPSKKKFFAIEPEICDSYNELQNVVRKTELQYHCKGLVKILHNKALSFIENVTEEAESNGIRKLKALIKPVGKTEDLTEGADNFVDRMLKRISLSVDSDDIADNKDEIENAFNNAIIEEDEYNLLIKAADDKLETLSECVSKKIDLESLNEDDEIEIVDDEEIDDAATIEIENDEEIEIVDDNCSQENTSEAASGVMDLIRDEWEAIKGYEDRIREIKADCEDDETFDKVSDVLDNIKKEELVHVGELQKLLAELGQDVEKIKEGDDEATALFAEIEENLKSISECNTLKEDIDEKPTFEDAIEEVKKWAAEDLKDGTVIEDVQDFRDILIDANLNGINDEGLFNLYSTTVEQLNINETLNEAIEEKDYINQEDEIRVTLNGDEVFKGITKDLFDAEKANEFYNIATVDGKIYKATDADGDWTIEIIKKAEKVDEELDCCHVCGKAHRECVCECNEELIENTNQTFSYKTRKELGEAVEKLKSDNKEFRVSRSLKEGYRYDLILIPSEDCCEDEIENTVHCCEPEVCPVCGKIIDNCECCCDNELDFDANCFDQDINDYFANSYEQPVKYCTKKGFVDKDGTIVLEGRIGGEKIKEKDIKFLLTSNNDLNESADQDKITYTVRNNLSEEIFEFTLNK